MKFRFAYFTWLYFFILCFPFLFLCTSYAASPQIHWGPYVYSNHLGGSGHEDAYNLELNIGVADSDGLATIDAVTVECPNGSVLELFDDGQHNDSDAEDGEFGLTLGVDPPEEYIGEYIFTITDEDENFINSTDNLERWLDFPTNPSPSNQDFVSSPSFTLTWDAVMVATEYHLEVRDPVEWTLMWWRGGLAVTSINFNDDGQAQPLVDGIFYQWGVGANDNQGNRSWHHTSIEFIYSNSTDSPLILSPPQVYSNHYGDETGNDEYQVGLFAQVGDPQGLGDIVSVTAEAPDGTVYTLFDDGNHGDREPSDGYYGLDANVDIPVDAIGNYTFTVEDTGGLTDVAVDTLERWLDIPSNPSPSGGAFISDPNFTLSWDAVADATSYGLHVYYSPQDQDMWNYGGMSQPSVDYNDDGNAQALTEGRLYHWGVGANDDENNGSWHHTNIEFVYSSSTDAPMILYTPRVDSNHMGCDGCDDEYLVALFVQAGDPQGLEDIVSVTAEGPDGTIYTLYDDGNHEDGDPSDGYFGSREDISDPGAAIGDYTFTVEDTGGLTADAVDTLERWLDLPANPSPSGGAFISDPNFTLSWDAVADATSYGLHVYYSPQDQDMWNYGGMSQPSVDYNDDGNAQALTEGRLYHWGVGANDDENNGSWHHTSIEFIYADSEADVWVDVGCNYIEEGITGANVYGIAIGNNGPGTAQNVVLNGNGLPTGLSNPIYEIDGVSQGAWGGSHDFGAINPDVEIQVEIYADVDPGLTEIDPFAVDISTDAYDPDDGNNSDSCANTFTLPAFDPVSKSSVNPFYTFYAIDDSEDTFMSISTQIDDASYNVLVENIPADPDFRTLYYLPGWDVSYPHTYAYSLRTSQGFAEPGPVYEGVEYKFYIDVNDDEVHDAWEPSDVFTLAPGTVKDKYFVSNVNVTKGSHPTITWDGIDQLSGLYYRVRIFPLGQNYKPNGAFPLFQSFVIPEDPSNTYSYTYTENLFEENDMLVIAIDASEVIDGRMTYRSRYCVNHTKDDYKLKWTQVSSGGFGDSTNESAEPLAVFNGYIYAGTYNETSGGQIWRCNDGTTWQQIISDGFGNADTTFLIPAAVFNGSLYAGTLNEVSGGEIWRTTDGTNWEHVAGGGMGDINTAFIVPYTTFNGQLYAGSGNGATGCKLWRSSDGESWEQVGSDGFGDANNEECLPMASSDFNGFLYVGTVNEATGAEIWCSSDGSIWNQVNVDGFGKSENISACEMAVFKGFLYAGVENENTGGGVWRTSDGTNWEQVAENGFNNANNIDIDISISFGGLLYAETCNEVTGGEIWKTSDGITWSQDNINGFGNVFNENITTLYPLNGYLYAGVENAATGGEIWRKRYDYFLQDTILILQLLSGIDPGDISHIRDINGDGKIDTVEAIYCIQNALK